jgi:hypothetical protein
MYRKCQLIQANKFQILKKKKIYIYIYIYISMIYLLPFEFVSIFEF